MKDIIVWGIHTPAGTVVLISAAIAHLTGKGNATHRKAGKWFIASMLIMLSSGFVAAIIKNSAGDMFLSAFVTYIVFTAWLTVHHNENEVGVLEHVALVWVALFGTVAFLVAAKSNQSDIADAALVWGVFSVLCVAGDLRNLKKGGLIGAQRIIRHVWRIGFSLLWALLALIDKLLKIQGYDIKDMPTDQTLVIVMFPVGIILATTVYWLLIISTNSRKSPVHHKAKRTAVDGESF